MPAATIVFTDIVGFSRKPTAVQKSLVESFTKEVFEELRPVLKPSNRKQAALALPTGDGMAVVFLHGSSVAWNLSTILHLIFRLQKWAWLKSKPSKPVSLRIGVHTGAVEILKDINNRPNFCGDTVNYAQRVMDSGGPGQVLFSDTAYRHYIGLEETKLFEAPFSGQLMAQFIGPIEVYAKHQLQIPVHKLILNPQQKWWSNADPIGKNIVPISLTPLPKEIAGSFSDRLKTASDIAFIQLTGDRFLKGYDEGKIKFSKGLKRFLVFMPDPEIYKRMNVTREYATSKFINACVKKWKIFLRTLRSKYPKAEIKLGLFKEPPYFGASFIDWERRGGVIHVSPYVWNIVASECPGYDLLWIGNEPSPVFRAYVKGLNYLSFATVNKMD